MRPGFLNGIDNYWFSGFEEEGFFDILTGRPRYPIPMYNIVRSERVRTRKGRLAEQLKTQPGTARTYIPKPAGIPYFVPHLQKVLETPKTQPRYSRYYWPAIL